MPPPPILATTSYWEMALPIRGSDRVLSKRENHGRYTTAKRHRPRGPGGGVLTRRRIERRGHVLVGTRINELAADRVILRPPCGDRRRDARSRFAEGHALIALHPVRAIDRPGEAHEVRDRPIAAHHADHVRAGIGI